MNNKSAEEHDQIIRSNKKPKRKINHLIFHSQTDEEMHDAQGKEDDSITEVHKEGLVARNVPESHSFREILQGTIRDASRINTETEEIDIDIEDVSDDEAIPEDILKDERCPVIQLTKEEKARLKQPWMNSLIIKLFSGRIDYMGLMRRHKKKWNIKGELALTDIGCNYYIARFSNQVDYNYVLTQGPWMLDDNYLTIRKWVPNFLPDESPIKVLTASVRIPNLPVEYFDINFLNKVGSKIGKVLRVDKTTTQAERGQFTRLSVEIDLSKPLLSKFWLKGRIWRIQYEVQKPEEKEDFESWMLVKKPTRKKPGKSANGPDEAANVLPGGSAGQDKGGAGGEQPRVEIGNILRKTDVGKNHGNGSRFFALEIETIALDKEQNMEVEDMVDSPKDREGTIFSSINLGENSQQNKSKDKFVHKDKAGKALKEKEINFTTPVIISNSNTSQGKENLGPYFEANHHATSQANQGPEKPEQVILTQDTSVNHVSNSTPDHSEHPPGENPICGTSYGTPVFDDLNTNDAHVGVEPGFIPTTNLEAEGIGGYNKNSK
ncbi:uncharacterized protein LOC110685734 [Chenopodium quinoa]|uniref:uncharacterized protein LOC110685734 n=1 Tax=Chenopodium quinoa TaxID=63459 RepID=UPI000B78175D|nr:uncharacterized protein LOC110685734 [Chenopodium quinoa]